MTLTMTTCRFRRHFIAQFLFFVLEAASLCSTTDALATAEGHRRAYSIVTGANGYLGKSIVHELLQDQQAEDRILCLVRPTRVESEEAYWKKYSSTSSNEVCVLPYDMLDGGKTLQRALEMADGNACCVYHVASNFGPTENHKQTALDNVKGTEDLVRTVAAHSLAHKLVLTSSMAAVRGTGQDPKNGKYYTAEEWNTLSELGANWGASYQWSKAQSEKRARELADEMGLPMVSLCPSFVFGPPRDIDSTSSYSIELVGQWVRGESQVQSRLFVDVRDTATVHVAAGRLDAANGKRYICSTEARVSSEEIAGWLSEVCAETGLADPKKVHYDAKFDGGAIKIGDRECEAEEPLKRDLGVQLRPVKDTIAGMAKILLGRAKAPDTV